MGDSKSIACLSCWRGEAICGLTALGRDKAGEGEALTSSGSARGEPAAPAWLPKALGGPGSTISATGVQTTEASGLQSLFFLPSLPFLSFLIYQTNNNHYTEVRLGLLWWLSGKELACQRRRCGFNPWVGTIPWRRKWQSISEFLPGKSYGQRSLAGYSPWSCRRVRQDLATKQYTWIPLLYTWN